MSARPGPPDDGRVRTVFLGSGGFAVPILRRLAVNPLVRVVAVVSAPPRRAGRSGAWTPTPVSAAAAALGLEPVLTPPRLRHPEAIDAILALRPALAVLADYGQLVPAALLDLPHGALNLHPSLLPRHRGASPIPATILAGDVLTGVTLMRMDAGLDTGPMVAQSRFALDGTERADELEEALAEEAAILLDDRLAPWLRGELHERPQPADGATFTRPLQREDGRLDTLRPAAELERQVRAYVPWPGSFVEVGGERLIVTGASLAPSEPGDEPGRLTAHGRGGVALATARGRLVLETVVPPGRRPMSGADWLRGHRAPPG